MFFILAIIFLQFILSTSLTFMTKNVKIDNEVCRKIENGEENR